LGDWKKGRRAPALTTSTLRERNVRKVEGQRVAQQQGKRGGKKEELEEHGHKRRARPRSRNAPWKVDDKKPETARSDWGQSPDKEKTPGNVQKRSNGGPN